eukprot:TRINITY_DN7577_c0_g1_i5.p1 TRINITY_DN7577_c0_g1~~TRINITY_DN7577_c0_g1_i5.p1  ORF type:complete len:218 (-),score=51.65 TRINITY_DN7577_c0_g1_i5:70-723(-)
MLRSLVGSEMCIRDSSLPTHRVSGRGQSIHQMGSSLPQSNNRRPGGNLSSSGAAFGSEEATIELSQNQLPGSIRGRDGGEHTIAPPPTGSQYFGSSLLGGSRNGFGGSSGMVGGSSVYSAFGGNSTVLDAPELKFLESSDNVPPPPQPEVQQHEPHNQYVNNVHAATIGPRDVGSSSPAHLSHPCLLYTSDAADEEDSVDLGGRRIIKKKKKKDNCM